MKPTAGLPPTVTCASLIKQLEAGRLAQVQAAIGRIARDDPQLPYLYTNLGVAYYGAGKREQARQYYQKALALNPTLVLTKFNLSMAMLVEGDFDGFALYEHRLRREPPDDPTRGGSVTILPGLLDKVRWDGGDLRGKHIVVWAEQGLGDNLMMLRYLPLLRARGAARVTVLCVPSLARTMATAADQVEVDPDWAKTAGFDVYCPSMSLPLCFGTRPDTIPAAVPYLTVPAATAQAWDGCLARLPGLKVGLVWAGGKDFKRDTLRSLNLRQLAPLMEVGGVHWISLQKGQAAEDLAEVDWRILDWAYHCDDLMDTAALVQQLDLVITVDTAMAHLAGALGKPVWMMSRFEGEWRWLAGRSDSPWYPTMRIFQQPAVKDWRSVLASVKQELAPLAAQAGWRGPLAEPDWAACVRDCAAGPRRAAKQGFFARWFG